MLFLCGITIHILCSLIFPIKLLCYNFVVNTDNQDWPVRIIQKLAQTSLTMVIRDLKDFTTVNDEPYYRGSGGILARALSMAEAKE